MSPFFTPQLDLAVQRASAEPHLPSRTQVRRWLTACLNAPAQLTVRFVDLEEGRALNRAHRGAGRDYATNVLTFVYESSPHVVADIVICAPVVAREAAELGKPVAEYWAHLVVHGGLHAQGYDHETSESDAFEMEALESWIMLGVLRLPDPYAA